MKSRIKIDSALAATAVLLTIFLFLNKKLFLNSPVAEGVLSVAGFILIIKGSLLRMAARGHKRAHSAQSGELVTSGPYQLIRNPMYLGTFFIGSGFVIMLWPIWFYPVFVAIFFLRFMKQVRFEEVFLSKQFGKAYEDYMKATPRFFPKWSLLPTKMSKGVFSWNEAFSTKEHRTLWLCLSGAVVCEIVQEKIVFNVFDPLGVTLTAAIVLSAILIATKVFYK